jgi:hypothetical protein
MSRAAWKDWIWSAGSGMAVKGARRENRRSCEVLWPSAASRRGVGCRRKELGLRPGLPAGGAWAGSGAKAAGGESLGWGQGCRRRELGLGLPATGVGVGAAGGGST